MQKKACLLAVAAGLFVVCFPGTCFTAAVHEASRDELAHGEDRLLTRQALSRHSWYPIVIWMSDGFTLFRYDYETDRQGNI